ncbi:MAG TPA: nitronate monooxygenase, partial [Jatrophihabitantaceae bacterium]|nr:nitronate monooxygenase [Jatrophihabitantaceae bacterium]
MPLLSELGLSVPIVAAPMAGGPTTPELVVAADRAGGIGFLAAGYLSAEALKTKIGAVRRQTSHLGV